MSNEEYKRFLKQNKTVLALLVMAIVVLLGSSYAWYSLSFTSEKEQSITAGELSLNLGESDQGINLEGAVPQSDEKGLTNGAYQFSITNNGTLSSMYTVYLDDAELTTGVTRMSDTVLKYNLIKNGFNNGVEYLSNLNNRLLVEGTIEAGETIEFSLRVWITEEATTEISGQEFRAKLRIEGSQLKHSPNEPKLVGEMIPVVYDEETGNWKKADYTKMRWYDYDHQMWANAVTIQDSTKRNIYQTANVGTTILKEDINTFMVWIPRYSYTLGNTYGYQTEGASDLSKGTPGAFNIKFVGKEKTDTGSGKYTGQVATNYYTPSSFCFGDTCDNETLRAGAGNKELTGIWISKFELSGGSYEPDSLEPDYLSSIPNVASLRNQSTSSFFTSIQTLMNGSNGQSSYGFNGEYDAHMIKNTEWGAMAYLSQSKYGKYGNSKYSGLNKEIYQNKSSEFITGNSNGTPSSSTTNTQVAYHIDGSGTGASTTGTIYGIYDTSGGALEYVMGNYNNYSGYSTTSNSGFRGPNGNDNSTTTGISFPTQKYYNLYKTLDQASSIKGDAYGADGTNGFYGDHMNDLTTGSVWITRGGIHSDNTVAGIFGFGNYGGNANNDSSTRMVLINK